MSAAELEDVKVMLKSLVVSSATSMDVRALARDFREMNGENIPYAKFGYKELLTFLKERCADCFVFSGYPGNPTIIPIITERTRHINNLVSKQRISTKDAKYKGKRTSVHESQVRPSHEINHKRGLEVNTVPSPRPDKAHFAPPNDRYSEKPMSKTYENNVGSSRGHIRGGRLKSPEKPLLSSHNRSDGKFKLPKSKEIDFQSTEGHTVNGGTLKFIDKQLVLNCNDRKLVEGKASKNVPIVGQRSPLSARNAVQNSLDYPSRGGIAKNPPPLDKVPPTTHHLVISKHEQTKHEKSPESASAKQPSGYSGHNVMYLNSIKSQLKKLLDAYPDGVWLDELDQIYKDMFEGCSSLDYKRLGHSSLEGLCRKLDDVLRLEDFKKLHRQLVLAAGSREQCWSGQPMPHTTLSSKHRSLSKYNGLYLNSVRSQLEELLDSYLDGVWLEELGEVYSDMFSCKLDYKRLGHSSLEKLCHELGDVLRLETVGSLRQQLVLAAGRPTPHRLPPPPPPSRLHKPQESNYEETDEVSGDSEEALGGMPYDEGIFPKDCMERLQSIPRLPTTLAEGEVVEMLVSEVLDPSHFWFQLRSEQHDLALNAIMEEMTQYYTNGEGRDRVMQFGAVQVGQYCATNFDVDGWHRSIIVQLVGPHSVKVRHIDFGSVITVERKKLRYLRKEWAVLPAQAIRGCLAQLRPAGGASCWMHSTARRFFDLVGYRPLVAEIHSVDKQAQVVRMFLADTTSEQDVYINRQLVEEKRASYVDFNTEILGDFLLPSFEDVENGNAMNFGDKSELLKSGIFPEGVERPFSLPVVVRRDECSGSPSPPPSPLYDAPVSGRSVAMNSTRIPLYMPVAETSDRAHTPRSSELETSISPALLDQTRVPLHLSSWDAVSRESDRLSNDFSLVNVSSRPVSRLSCVSSETNSTASSWPGWQTKTEPSIEPPSPYTRHELHTPTLHNFNSEQHHITNTKNPTLSNQLCSSVPSPPLQASLQMKMNSLPHLGHQMNANHVPIPPSHTNPPWVPTHATGGPLLPSPQYTNAPYPSHPLQHPNQPMQYPNPPHYSSGSYPSHPLQHPNQPMQYPNPPQYNSGSYPSHPLQHPNQPMQYPNPPQYNSGSYPSHPLQHPNQPMQYPNPPQYNSGSYPSHSLQHPNQAMHYPNADPFFQPHHNPGSFMLPTRFSSMGDVLQPNGHIPNMEYLTQPTNHSSTGCPSLTTSNLGPFMQSTQYPNTGTQEQPTQFSNIYSQLPAQHPNTSSTLPSQQSNTGLLGQPDGASVWDLVKDTNILSNSNNIEMALCSVEPHFRKMKMRISIAAPPNLTQVRQTVSNMPETKQTNK